MYAESELLPLSGLAHLAYCERRWALIHIERLWEENALTAQGRLLHERVHSGSDELRGGVRIVRGLPVRSLRLGLFGVADLVEFPPPPAPPLPVEFKRGKPKADRSDEVQLCAQGMCLEEMLGVAVPRGAFFYARPRRRVTVEFDDALRAYVEHLCERMHELFRLGRTPAARYERRCRSCSLVGLCEPRVSTRSRSAEDWFEGAWKAAASEG